MFVLCRSRFLVNTLTNLSKGTVWFTRINGMCGILLTQPFYGNKKSKLSFKFYVSHEMNYFYVSFSANQDYDQSKISSHFFLVLALDVWSGNYYEVLWMILKLSENENVNKKSKTKKVKVYIAL